MNTLTQIKTVIAGELKKTTEELDENIEVGNIAGWDSMTHIAVITAIEEHFDIKFSCAENQLPPKLRKGCSPLAQNQ